ncbi:MAG TPA: APC family permease, partial [Chloroflexota bacterium]|nr:APC family permease [Chloroflexota bacterium]
MAIAGLPVTTSLPSPIARRQLTLWPLVMVMFFTVSGGPYGLEELVSQSGAGMSLLLIVVTPVIWSIPTALMVAELSSMMPVEGGYYAWVKKALGPFWGFQEGWWSWISSFVDMAIYPVLFASYLSALLEQANITVLEEHAWAHWLVTLAVIWPLAYLNIRGAKPVGFSSVVFGLLVLAPFVVLSAIGIVSLMSGEGRPWEPLTPDEMPLVSAFGLGLFVVMWNYQGWDSVSTVGEEIVRPRRTIPSMLLITVPLVILTYLLPTLAGLTAQPDISEWTEGSFPQIAAEAGGAWLGTWVAIGGLVSAVALYSANLLSISRVPFVLAADGYLPQSITRTHPRYGTPWVAITVCSIIYSIFSISTFANLVVIDVIVYAATPLL